MTPNGLSHGVVRRNYPYKLSKTNEAKALDLFLSFRFKSQINNLALLAEARNFTKRYERLMRYCGLLATGINFYNNYILILIQPYTLCVQLDRYNLD